MEAAACYIGECKNPERDAKIAMNLEGAYGAFIYIMIPVSFVVILGREQLASIGFDPKTVFVTFAGELFGGSAGSFLNWAVSIMLIVALMLSALNAIMGCARGLHQMAIDGQFPRIFARVNKHGVPSFAMGFNVVASIVVVFMGGAVRSTCSRTSATWPRSCRCCSGTTCSASTSPEFPRPVRLPPYFGYIALAMFGFYLFIWAVGGPLYASLPLDTDFNPATDNGDGKIYWILGIITLLAYVPFYLYRRYFEDMRHKGEPVAGLTDVELAEVIRDK